jgi:hypothetical protein
MRIFRQTRTMKLLLAAIVLVNGFGTTPMIGHAHGLPHRPPDDHHVTWADHDHSLEHLMPDESDQHPDLPTVGDSIFHLHGVWFGIPFSLPSPTRPASNRIDSHPLADTLATMGMTASARPGMGWQPVLWPPGHLGCGPALDADLHVSDHLQRTSPSPDGAISPCALRVRTVLIRC